MTGSVIKRLRNWPKPRTHEEKVEQTIDRLMLVEAWLYWYIAELEDLREQLSKDVVFRRLAPIVDVMIKQLWQLMRRWAKVKAEVIREAKKGLMRKKRKIEGNGFTIQVTYHKGVIDLQIHLHGGSGNDARIPNLGIPETVLRAIRMGWRASDSSNAHNRYLRMTTNFVWQVLSWLIVHPGADVNIYAQGISIGMSGIKPMWQLYINGFNVEWFDDKSAYEEMMKLPKGLFLISFLHSVLGDGHNKVDYGYRVIYLSNKDRSVLELVAKRLEGEFRVKGSIYPDKTGYIFWISGENAKKLSEAIIEALKELAPEIVKLYSILSNYTLIRLEKWIALIRISRYIYGESKVWFIGLAWSPNFTPRSIKLSIASMNIDYVEMIRRKLEEQGINATVTKHVWKGRSEGYIIWIEWSELKRHLCNPELRGQVVRVAERAVENCRIINMMNKDKKRDCDNINAAKMLRKLQDIKWLRSIGCSEA